MSRPTAKLVIANETELTRAALRLARYEDDVADLRKAIADYQVNQIFRRRHDDPSVVTPPPDSPDSPGSPRSLPVSPSTLSHVSSQGHDRVTSQRSSHHSPMRTTPDGGHTPEPMNQDPAAKVPEGPSVGGFRLLEAADGGKLQGVAIKTCVDYTALMDFLGSNEVHTFAWDFLVDHEDQDTNDFIKYFAWEHPDRERDWCRFFAHQERLILLRREMIHGRYGLDGRPFDYEYWVNDGDAPIDKSHFTFADHITRFILLCENYRLMSGRVDWSNENFGHPKRRMEIYKAILMLFMRAFVTGLTAGKGARVAVSPKKPKAMARFDARDIYEVS